MKRKKALFKIIFIFILSVIISCFIGAITVSAADDPKTLTNTGGTLSGHYILNNDIKLKQKITVAKGNSLTIDLNGYVLEGTGKAEVIYNQGTLTIIDSRPNEGGRWFLVKSNAPWEMYGSSPSDRPADTTGYKFIKGGIITGGYYSTTSSRGGGGISMPADDTNGKYVLHIYGGTIIGNYSARAGGGSYGGTVTMWGGTVTGNYANQFGGGLSLSGHLTMHGGLVELNNTNPSSSYNNPNNSSGKFYDYADIIIGYQTQFTMTGGTIRGNISTVYSAGSKAPTFTISGGEIIGNFRLLNELTATFSGGSLNGYIYMKKGTCIVKENAYIFGGSRAEGGSVYIASGSFSMEGGIIEKSHATESGGAIHIDGGTCTISGGIIQSCSSKEGGAIYIGNGSCNIEGVAQILNCSATTNGGAIYMGGGTMNVSDGVISQNTALADGGAIYMGGGALNVSGGTISSNKALNGAGALVANGNVSVTGGTITNNLATENGGAFSITNGNYTMTGGEITLNKAVNGDGGAIYISSSKDNTNIIVRSGRITDNSAGNSGGAMGVHGQDGVSFTITIGANTAHTAGVNFHECDGNNENCPVIESNTAIKSGGGIYLSGSYDAKMNMYCIVEQDNKVGSGDTLGVSPSNFMMVEGGTLLISTKAGDQHGNGNVVINSSVHVTGGQVTLMGRGDNPKFNEPITVNVDETNNSFFKDLREKSDNSIFTVQYFENFEENGKTSGQYIAMDVDSSQKHVIRAALYNHTGHTIQGWIVMESDSEGNHIPSDPLTMYTAGIEIDVKNDIILYARWSVSGYTIIFEAGVNSYQGEMSPQEFDYTEKKPLSENTFVNVGYVFDYWIDKSTIDKPLSEQIKYSNKQVVGGLSIVHGAKITLVAVWKICYHNDMSDYQLSSTDTSISRQCSCLGYTETATVTGGTFTYIENHPYPANVKYDRISLNGEHPTDKWDLTPVYTGKNWSDVDFVNVTEPVNAGTYTATVTFNGFSASVAIVINKAERTPPKAPEYTVTTSADGQKNIIKISTPDDSNSDLLEYQFSWYEGSVFKQSIWTAWDPIDIPFKELDVAYTNYYVDVRYEETDNYLASISIRGEYIIYYTGNVVFHITADDETLIPNVVWGNGDQSGVTVTLTPQSGYYIYNITASTFESNIDGYSLPKLNHQEKTGDRWVVWINDIKSYSTEGGVFVHITIHFTGAEKKITVDSAVAKDQQFNDITKSPQAEVTISRDSAYTFAFSVNNYLYYNDPFIDFGSASLPEGTTVIMKDHSDSSYWSYKALSSVSKIYLDEFIRMGTSSSPEYFDLQGRTAFSLQFITDFSRCDNTVNIDTLNSLNASFKATVQPPDGINTVPQIPEGSDVEIDLTDRPSFSIIRGDTTDELTQAVTFQFAQVITESAGISKWSDKYGLLIIEPYGNTVLPADARLQVRIGNSTEVYELIGGKFIVTLPYTGSGTAYLALLSDMFANEDSSFEFTVKLGFAETQVKNAPSQTELNADTLRIGFNVAKTVIPSVNAVLNGSNPEYKNGTISSVGFTVTVRDASNYTVRAVLYNKNEDGEYSSTTQTMYLEMVNGVYDGSLDLSSLKDMMSQKIGSLSLMLKIEVVDGNGKTVTSVPLYFILVDTRQ